MISLRSWKPLSLTSAGVGLSLLAILLIFSFASSTPAKLQWNVEDHLVPGACRFGEPSLVDFVDYVYKHGYLPWGGYKRVLNGEWPWALGTFSPTLDCPEAVLALPWINGTAQESSGVVSCQPGQPLIHVGMSFVGTKDVFCPDSGQFQLEVGEAVIGEKGIRARAHFEPAALKRSREYWDTNEREKTPNILFILQDAVSRQAYDRSLKRTEETLSRIVKEHGTRRFKYDRAHSVGGSSLRNMTPMFTGALLPELKKWMKKHNTGGTYGGWIYETIKSEGYVSVDIHNGCLRSKDPWPYSTGRSFTKHYPQHYMKTPEVYDVTFIDPLFCDREKTHLVNRMDRCAQWPGDTRCYTSNEGINMRRHPCGSGRSRTSVITDYYLDVRESYKGVPTFSVFRALDIHLADLMSGWRYDVDVEASFLKLEEAGVFEDTIVFYLSDHGNQFGYMKERSGGLEYKMPFWHMFIPEKFYSKLSEVEQKALEQNQKVLVGPQDIHATIWSLASWPEDTTPPTADGLPVSGTSILTPMNATRSCADAGIPAIECICGSTKPQPLPAKYEPFLKSLLQLALDEQTKTLDASICRPLLLKEVVKAEYVELSKDEWGYMADFSVESGRTEDMVLYVEILGPVNADVSQVGSFTVETIVQLSHFEEWLKPCVEAVDNAGINRHICDCVLEGGH